MGQPKDNIHSLFYVKFLVQVTSMIKKSTLNSWVLNLKYKMLKTSHLLYKVYTI